MIIDSLDMSYDREQVNQDDDDDDLANERDVLASLIEKLKCEINDSKNHNRFLKTSNNALVDKLKDQSLDVQDLKKFQAELDRYHDVKYASKVEINCAKDKGELMSYKMKAQRVNPYLYDIGCYNDNLALMLSPESNEVIRLEKESRSKLSDLIRPFDYEKLNNLYDLFVPQREKSSAQDIFQKSTCYIRDLKGNDLLTAWLWHRRLSHLNFDTIKLLSKNDIVIRLPKLKFVKDHLCSSCELGKAKRKSFQIKTTRSSKRRLQLLHMELCGPMWVESINGEKYVLVTIDDYSRYTWTYFLRSKDETPEVLIDFLRFVQRGLHAQVRIVQTDKGTEFLNKTIHAYFVSEGIKHQTSVARTPEQNGVVKRWNRTLVEAARTMLSAAKLRAYRVFNKRTRVIVETIHVNFGKLPQMASDRVIRIVTTSNELDLLFSLMFDELLNGSTQVVSTSSVVTTADAPNQCQQQHTTQSTTTIVAADTTPLNTQTTHEHTCQDPTQAPTVTSTKNINQAETVTENAQVEDDEFINIFCTPTKDHPLEQVIGNPSQSVRTKRQIESDGEMCMFALT
nr:hypothetical protein [Tanacetum cinerariifolium]